MKRISYFLLSAVLVSTAVNPTTASAASTYTLNLSVYESDGLLGLFSDESQTAAAGAKKCLRGFYFSGASINKMIVTKSSKVKVLNESSKMVGLGTLSTLTWKKAGTDVDSDGVEYPVGNCIFSAKIKLKKSDFYSIQITGVDETFDISHSDLVKKKWKLTLTI
jgi:hypothetical protein